MEKCGLYGFSEVLTREKAEARYGLYGKLSFIVETDGYTEFCDDWNGKAVRIREHENLRYGYSSHGHMPEKGQQPPMIVCGPDFAKGIVLERNEIINEAPTFARLLELNLLDAEGKPISELLR